MKGAMWSGALVLTALVGFASANPVTTKEAEYTAVLQSAQCGGHAEIVVEVGETVLLSTEYLLSTDSALPAGCDISWRIAVQASGLENYGMEVSGILELDDTANDGEECTSSLLELTDQDDEGDTTAISQTVCGNKDISYLTYQDSVTVNLRVADYGVIGRGFSLKFTPIFACGGILAGSSGDTVEIATPDFPNPYPRDLSCVWDIESSDGSSATVTCEKFALLGRRKGACSDYLMVQQDADLQFFCGRELSGRKRSYQIETNEAMLYFRSSGRRNPAPGFQCSITFE